MNALTPARGRTVRVELTPKEVGTFQITCSRTAAVVTADEGLVDCDAGHVNAD